MKVSYYPGCTLKTGAKNLEDAAIASMSIFGVELEELPSWNCCGAVSSLAHDDLIRHVAPARILIRAMEQGRGSLVTLCSMCYNTLARTNVLMRNDEKKRRTINLFMDEEPDYYGEIEVLHFLSFLEQEIGWDTVREKIKYPLKGLKVAPYYGCTLHRPREVGIEPPGSFKLMSRFIEALGASVVHFPAVDLCCGSYQIVGNPGAAKDVAANILRLAVKAGAEALVLSCPLCEFNLGQKQGVFLEEKRISKVIPTFYFTQLLAIALGISPEICRFDLNRKASMELLKSRNYHAALHKVQG